MFPCCSHVPSTQHLPTYIATLYFPTALPPKSIQHPFMIYDYLAHSFLATERDPGASVVVVLISNLFLTLGCPRGAGMSIFPLVSCPIYHPVGFLPPHKLSCHFFSLHDDVSLLATDILPPFPFHLTSRQPPLIAIRYVLLPSDTAAHRDRFRRKRLSRLSFFLFSTGTLLR